MVKAVWLVKFILRLNFQIEKKPRGNVTSVVYSNNGDAILASYNDDDIYLFDTSLGEGEEYIHSYSGHRNSATGKFVFPWFL